MPGEKEASGLPKQRGKCSGAEGGEGRLNGLKKPYDENFQTARPVD